MVYCDFSIKCAIEYHGNTKLIKAAIVGGVVSGKAKLYQKT